MADLERVLRTSLDKDSNTISLPREIIEELYHEVITLRRENDGLTAHNRKLEKLVDYMNMHNDLRD